MHRRQFLVDSLARGSALTAAAASNAAREDCDCAVSGATKETLMPCNRSAICVSWTCCLQTAASQTVLRRVCCWPGDGLIHAGVGP